MIRFYVPAIGLIALLAVWFVMQLPRWLAPVIAGLAVVAALGSYHSLTAGGGLGGAFPGGSFGSGSAGRLPAGFKPPSGSFRPPSGSFRPPSGNYQPPSAPPGQ